MVGVAILTFASSTYQYAGSSSIFSWILAGVFSIFMALIYAEMVTAFPSSGAIVTFPYEAFGKNRISRYLAFLEGTGYYIGTLFGIVISAIILGSYISPVFATGTFGSFVIAEVSLIFAGVINLLGAKITSRVNLLMSLVFMVIFALVIILGFHNGSIMNMVPFFGGSSGISGILYAVPIAILAYGSWTAVITVPEETKDMKSMPKAIIYSLLVVTVLYSLLVMATYMNLNQKQLENTFYYYPVLGLVTLLGNHFLLLAFQFAALLAIVAVMIVMIMSNARILMALGKLKFVPKNVGVLNNKSIPVYATLLSLFIPMVLSALPSYYYQYVIIGAIIGTGLPRVIDIASYIKLRRSQGYSPRYRVKYGMLVALIAFFGLAISELSLGINDLEWSLVALAVMTLVFLIIEKYHKKSTSTI
ncbi:MAG: APC family permease [Candidatus Marsarchaeota archaeon]|jgi:APA family basic amino acid/polyamine antiporter|nr:APC family permease [Candidatus Marsarchaeota archaeon]